jgi:hypothetical protein
MKKKEIDDERYKNCTFKPDRITSRNYEKKTDLF